MSDRRSSGINPPNSRLFVIGSKSLTEKDYWNAFQEYGEIEEVWVVKDRNTGENKGVTYIKYAKTSQAAKALEAMNGKFIGSASRNIKVMVASSKEQGTKRDDKETEEERTTRLFVKIPKDWTKTELFDAFKTYGNIDYANVLKDRNTNENKGFGFVKYFKFSDAARAFEECDKSFRAVFAEPKHSMMNRKHEDNSFQGFDDNFRDNSPNIFRNNPRSNNAFLPPPHVVNREGFTGLIVSCSPLLRQDELWRLFDIIPELEYCELRVFGPGPRPARAVASVVYSHPKWAAYALEKLHGFEYPIGIPLLIKPDIENHPSRASFSRNLMNDRDHRDSRAPENRGGASSTLSSSPDLSKLAETLAQASNLLQAAGISPVLVADLLTNKLTGKAESVCNVKLPDVKPLADIDAPVEARCFIVCSPNPPPISILRDIFCRFGNLIDVYLLSGKNCGYAKYTKKECAQEAIKTLHGAEICGCRVKVLEAVDQPESNRKRPRMEDDHE